MIISTGSLLSPALALGEPSSQLDVVFPSSGDQHPLSAESTSYAKAALGLCDAIEYARTWNDTHSQGPWVILATSRSGEDAWSIDDDGVLTVRVCKATYERLGLVGVRRLHRYDIQISLFEPAGDRARSRAAFEAWDARRNAEGIGPWDVLYHCASPDMTTRWATERRHEVCVVHCETFQIPDIRIPLTIVPPPPSNEDLDDGNWTSAVASLSEWVGIVTLGSDPASTHRLQATDSVDPYVAMYDPPAPFQIGHVTHLRWRGLLSGSFVQSVINCLMEQRSQFVSIISHERNGHTSCLFIEREGTRWLHTADIT